MKNLASFREIVKYYAAGAIVNGGGYLIFLLLIALGVEHKIAASAIYVIGVISSYWLNRKFVFNSSSAVNFRFVRLFLMLVSGYLLNMLMLYVFVDIYKFLPGLVQLIAVFLISIYFYFVNKFFVHGDFK